MATTRKVNKFSIFRYAEFTADLWQSFPNSERAVLTVGRDNSSTDIYRAVVRTQLVKGSLIGDEIPHFDNIGSIRLFLWAAIVNTSPELTVHELNNDTTKYFTAGASWNSYKGQDRDSGCAWSEAGGDYEGTALDGLGQASGVGASEWWYWDLGDSIKSSGFNNLDWLSFLIKENEIDNNDYAVFSGIGTGDSQVYSTDTWRGDEFGNGKTYLSGSNSGLRSPYYEIIYEDEVPESIIDLKISADEDKPERISFEWSESSAEDIQGYMIYATTDIGNPWPKDTAGAGDETAYGWVDNRSISSGSTELVVCAGFSGVWAANDWQNYRICFINGNLRGLDYPIASNDTLAILTIGSASEPVNWSTNQPPTYNDQFVIFQDTPSTTELFGIETNKGFFVPRAPDDDYEVSVDLSDLGLTANVKYYFFVQPIDNLSCGPKGNTSNYVEFVRPLIMETTDFEILATVDEAIGNALDVYEELFPAVFAVGFDNTVTPVTSDFTTGTAGLKGMRKIEIQTGEGSFFLDTYSTILTGAEASDQTIISVDLSDIPKEYYRVGNKVLLIDKVDAGGGTPGYDYDYREITAVGDDTITLDSAIGDAYAVNTTSVYIIKPFIYTEQSTKAGVKARVYNEQGVASAWKTVGTSPAPRAIPGNLTTKVGPLDAEKDETSVNMNMGGSLPKASNLDIANFHYQFDNGGVVTADTDFVQTLASYSSTGTKNTFAFMSDDQTIVSPAVLACIDYASGGGTYGDETRACWGFGGADVTPLQATNDILYLAFDRPLDGIYVDVSGAWTGITLDPEYWDGSAWVNFDDIVDDTSELTVDGTITWTRPTDWSTTSLNTIKGSAATLDSTIQPSDSAYYFRIVGTGISGAGTLDNIIPLESGLNYAQVTVTDPAIIDLDNANVLEDGYTAKSIGRDRFMYHHDGVLGSDLKQGRLKTPTISIEGVAFSVGSLLLSSWDATPEPVWAGAANTSDIPDDVQIMDDIIENGRLVKITDQNGTEWTGYIQRIGWPKKIPGHPRFEWNCKFIPDINR